MSGATRTRAADYRLIRGALQGPKARRRLSGMAAQARSAAGAAEPADRPRAFEYRSRLKIGRLPLVHVVSGIDPSTGRRPPAIGVIAVGQVAVGIVAVGQVAHRGDQHRTSRDRARLGYRPGRVRACWRPVRSRPGCWAPSVRSRSGPDSIGMVHVGGPGSPLGWLVGGLALAAAIAERRRRLGAAAGAGDRGADPLRRAHRRDGPRGGSNRLARSAARRRCLARPACTGTPSTSGRRFATTSTRATESHRRRTRGARRASISAARSPSSAATTTARSPGPTGRCTSRRRWPRGTRSTSRDR